MFNFPIDKMDWNFTKTKTLLYFYEYVMRKGEPQRIDNLSCLFGEKDFTDDMRGIVGRSLAGLKQLLSEHPNLFKIIDGELVYLNVDAKTADVAVERSSNEETKEYFVHKLLTYGIGAEVPIKSLHGHRSQAPLRVRHTSGAHTKDFKQFLSQYPETFQIVDKNVSLLGFDHLKPNRNTLSSGLPTDDNRQNRDNRSVAIFDFTSKEKLQNLCAFNCPEIWETVNVFSPVQLYVGGIGSKVQIRKNAQVISTVADSLHVTGEILKFVVDTGAQAVVSFNCKGSRSATYTEMTLLELGTPDGYTFIFDVLTCPQIMTDGGVKELLENDRIVKVIHNCRYKSGNLYEQYKIILKCVFDIQVANAVLQHQTTGTRVDKVKSLSLYQLIQLYCPFNSGGHPFTTYRYSSRERPFTDEMIVYAAREILAQVQLYGCMALLIKENSKPLLSHLCTEEILAYIHQKELKAHQMERNIGSDAVKTQSQTTKSPKTTRLRSVASALDYDSVGNVTQQGSTRGRCCDCYVDKENQTLSTGDIVMLSKTYNN